MGYCSLYFLPMLVNTYKGTADELTCGLLKPLVLYMYNIYHNVIVNIFIVMLHFSLQSNHKSKCD